jgi:hypothetical protein
MQVLFWRVRSVLLGLTLAVLLFVLNSATPAAAAPTFNLTTSPLPILLATKPGQTVSTNLRVQNSGTETVNLKVTLKKFKADGATGKPQLSDPLPSDDYFNWVSFSPQRFRADPGVWNNVTMTIKVPEDAGLGYYYAPVFSIDETPDQPIASNASHLQGATAILVLLDVQVPGEKRQLQITSFSADKKLYEYLPANFKVKVSNTGDIHLSPSGTVFITKGKKTVATLDVNPAGGNILPKSSRDFAVAWSDGFPVFSVKRNGSQIVTDKRGKPVMQLNWNFGHANRLRFGHYSAHLVLTYDNGTRDVPLEATVSFWVVPWKILPIILLALVLIGIGLWTSGKNIFRRVRRNSKPS